MFGTFGTEGLPGKSTKRDPSEYHSITASCVPYFPFFYPSQPHQHCNREIYLLLGYVWYQIGHPARQKTRDEKEDQ